MGKTIFGSSIGRKLVMSITGIFLVLFLTFHAVMNLVVVISPAAYNDVCAFLGANWYAVAGTIVLATGVAIHFLYASWLTLRNLRARGKKRYAVEAHEQGVSWASKNMYILGAVIILGLLLHLWDFWYNMMFVELSGEHLNTLGQSPTNGAWLVQWRFSQPLYVGLYLVWFGALWLHLTHGVWSMLQSQGWNNAIWTRRIKRISYIVATLLMGAFALVAVALYIKSLYM